MTNEYLYNWIYLVAEIKKIKDKKI